MDATYVRRVITGICLEVGVFIFWIRDIIDGWNICDMDDPYVCRVITVICLKVGVFILA